MERQELDLRALGQALRRRWRTWLIAAILGVGLAYGVTTLLPKRYEATTTVVLKRSADAPGTADDQMRTDAALAHSGQIAGAVITHLGLAMKPDDLLLKYSATARTTEVLDIVADTSTAKGAAQIADDVAAQFLLARRDSAKEAVTTLTDSLNGRIDDIDKSIKQVDAQITSIQSRVVAAGQPRPDITNLLDQRNALTAQRTDLDSRIQDAALKQQLVDDASKVVQPATVPAKPSFPSLKINLALGLIGGLGLGMGLVVLSDLFNGRLRRRGDVAVAAGAPVLAGLRLGNHDLNHRQAARLLREPSLDVARATNAAVAHLTNSANEPAVVVVGSLDCDTEGPVFASALATALSRAGRVPVLIDLSVKGDELRQAFTKAEVLDGEPDEVATAQCFSPQVGDDEALQWKALAQHPLALLKRETQRDRATAPGQPVRRTRRRLAVAYVAGWSDPEDLAALQLEQAVTVLLVGAGRSNAATIEKHVRTYQRIGAPVTGVVLVQPDRNDDSSGHIDQPPPRLAAIADVQSLDR